jgi:hypothetical protein
MCLLCLIESCCHGRCGFFKKIAVHTTPVLHPNLRALSSNSKESCLNIMNSLEIWHDEQRLEFSRV